MLNSKNATALMSYYNNNTQKMHTQYLWVQKLVQDNTLTGISYQSKYTRHFYPKFYSPGNLTITCFGDGQTGYQDTAKFIRGYHKFISNTNVQTKQNLEKIANVNYFISLIIKSEQVYYIGMPDNISLNKKGVYDPIPVFSFTFIPIYSYNKPTNFNISNDIQSWYSSNVGDTPSEQQNIYNNPNIKGNIH